MFLEQYVTESMVPRSLRWDVSPQKGEVDLEEWFKYFNSTGVKFLGFLIQRKNNKLIRLDGEIKLIKEKLVPHINSEEYKERSSVLKKLLEKEEIEQKNKKRKKYNRNIGDYKRGAVFGWQSKFSGGEGDGAIVPNEPPPPLSGQASVGQAEDRNHSPYRPSLTQLHPTNTRRVSYRSPARQQESFPSRPKTPRRNMNNPQRKTSNRKTKSSKKPSQYKQDKEYNEGFYEEEQYGHNPSRLPYLEDQYTVPTYNRFQPFRDNDRYYDSRHYPHRATQYGDHYTPNRGRRPNTPVRSRRSDQPSWYQPPRSRNRDHNQGPSHYPQRDEYHPPQPWGFPRVEQKTPIEREEESEGGGGQNAKRKRE